MEVFVFHLEMSISTPKRKNIRWVIFHFEGGSGRRSYLVTRSTTSISETKRKKHTEPLHHKAEKHPCNTPKSPHNGNIQPFGP